jgi:hypothetical protein
MCDKFIELDEKIARYRRISSTINDQLTIDRIKSLIVELEAQKAAFTPNNSKAAFSWQPLSFA